MTGPRRLVALSHTALRSGAEAVLMRCLRWASDGGWDVLLLAPEGELLEDAESAGLATAPSPDLKLPDLPRATGMAVTAARGAAAGRALRRQAVDANLVLVNGLLALPALWVSRRLGMRCPTAWLVHDVNRRRDQRALIRAFGGAADLAIAVSESAAEPLRQQGRPVTVVRNGTRWPVDPAAVTASSEVESSRGPTGADRLVIGCAGLLTRWKGQHVLLEAVARLERSDVALQLAGGSFPKDAEYRRALERRASRADLAGRVEFLGHVSDPLATMRSWTIGVNASVDPEAGPLVVLEYMSLGLPVVATYHGGTRELLADAGIGVRPGDPDAMAAALTELLDDPVRRREMGAAGRAAVESHLTLDHQRGRVLDVLDHVSGASHGPGRGGH